MDCGSESVRLAGRETRAAEAPGLALVSSRCWSFGECRLSCREATQVCDMLACEPPGKRALVPRSGRDGNDSVNKAISSIRSIHKGIAERFKM